MSAQVRKATGDASWWIHDRFGTFIHWGVYALPARERSEWIKSHERLTDEEYQRYFDHFNPDRYDPAAWARAAKDVGMKYMVITTKHMRRLYPRFDILPDAGFASRAIGSWSRSWGSWALSPLSRSSCCSCSPSKTSNRWPSLCGCPRCLCTS